MINFYGQSVAVLTIHAGQELSYNSSFHLPLSAFSFWGDSIYFIYE